MRRFSCDLHIHSTLSPCGSLEMSPRNIVEKAHEIGLDIIAITDHNMTENSYYAKESGAKFGITVLSGMELQTLEEIHLLAIFDEYETAFGFQKKVYDLLPDIHNDWTGNGRNGDRGGVDKVTGGLNSEKGKGRQE